VNLNIPQKARAARRAAKAIERTPKMEAPPRVFEKVMSISLLLVAGG